MSPNLAASVRARLLNVAKVQASDFNQVLHLLSATSPRVSVRWSDRADGALGTPLRAYRPVAGWRGDFFADFAEVDQR